MPKRQDLQKILIIGSGPIIIGQACEFDYSGTQACKALKTLGYHVVLVNSNPATIMTDPNMADQTYIEPLNVQRLTEIIRKERPDALLPNLGGQSGLNLCYELADAGVLDEYDVEVIGVNLEAIKRGEDRITFKETMARLNIDMPKSKPAFSVDEALSIADELGYPVVIRPAYTLGGTGGGLVYNVEECANVANRGISASMIGQILVEESVLGWEELELEVVRDAKGQKVTVCYIENVDAMGVHTGDSFCTAPMLDVDETIQARLQKHAYDIVEAIEVIGGTNVQFAHDPVSDRITVIEINPRTSRSSALASKATGFPIAYISALLAAGLTLDEIPYWKEGTLDRYTPTGDYVVVKFARWAFEKFKGAQDKLGTQMKAVGEVMSIGKTYKEALQKAIRSLEIGRYGLGFAKNYHELDEKTLLQKLSEPSSERQFLLYEALRKGISSSKLCELTHIKPYFMQQMKELVDTEQEILRYKGQQIPRALLKKAKCEGFSDRYLSMLLDVTEEDLRKRRQLEGIVQQWDRIRVSGVEDAEYYYSTYHECRSHPIDTKKKVMVLGGGPNRIGQGIEFDYCCVHAAFAMRDMGYETIMVNCNPETVSTDYDTSDRLYFEPLTVEDVLSIYEKEKPMGVIVQFGGQTPLNIANELEQAGVTILGTTPDTIDLAEDRDRFRRIMQELEIPMPMAGMAHTSEGALKTAHEIGYPVIVRPSYVLGGQGMEIIHDSESMMEYMHTAVDVSGKRPLLIDKFLENAIEAEADAIADGTHAFVPAIMEHIELAGIHSGDSACVIPSISISPEHKKTIFSYTEKISKKLQVTGLMNMQYAVFEDRVYVLEANPRASRTVPLVSKVCNISMAKIATEIMANPKEALEQKRLVNMRHATIDHFGVKEAVFPFNMFSETDPLLGPEMRSTGEVLGLAHSFGLAFFKAQEGTRVPLPESGTVLISVFEKDRPGILETAKRFQDLGFTIIATRGTHAFLQKHNVQSSIINKMKEGRPNILDAIMNRTIGLVINTPNGKASKSDDSYIRKAAIKYKIPYITTVAAANASAMGIDAYRKNKNNGADPRSLQEYHAGIHISNDS